MEIDASDHNLIYAFRKQPKVLKDYKYVWCHSFRWFEPSLFEWDVLFADWRNVTKEINPSTAWDNLVITVNKILDIHAPFKNIRIPESMPRWVTTKYFQACDERDYHLRQYSKSKTDENRARRNHSRNYCTMLEQHLKRDYFCKQMAEYKGNSRKLWDKINEAFGKKK